RRAVPLFLDDHRAIGNRSFAFAGEPAHHAGGVVDADGFVRAEVSAVDPRPGVADAFVDAPAELRVLVSLKPGEDLGFVSAEVIAADRVRRLERRFLGGAGALRLSVDVESDGQTDDEQARSTSHPCIVLTSLSSARRTNRVASPSSPSPA